MLLVVTEPPSEIAEPSIVIDEFANLLFAIDANVEAPPAAIVISPLTFPNTESSKLEKVTFFSVPPSLIRNASAWAIEAPPSAFRISILKPLAATPVRFEPSPINEPLNEPLRFDSGFTAVALLLESSCIVSNTPEFTCNVTLLPSASAGNCIEPDIMGLCIIIFF